MLIDDSIREFLKVHSAEDFPYSKEVIALLREYPTNGLRIEMSTGALTDRLRDTYRTRAKIAWTLQSATLPRLRVDVASLAKSLEDAKDQPIRFWSLWHQGARVYMVFELLEDARIAGCLDTIDAREQVDPDWSA